MEEKKSVAKWTRKRPIVYEDLAERNLEVIHKRRCITVPSN